MTKPLTKVSLFSLPFLFTRNITSVAGQSQLTYTFAIVTTHASKALSWLHDRQPVILSTPDEINRWLDTSQIWSSDLARLLHPWEDTTAALQWYVSRPFASHYSPHPSTSAIRSQRKLAKSVRSLPNLSSLSPSAKMVSWLCSLSNGRNKSDPQRNGNVALHQLRCHQLK